MATVDEAIDVLGQLGFPRQQRNERSGLALLVLLDLTPDRAWSDAADPLRGITQLLIDGQLAERGSFAGWLSTPAVVQRVIARRPPSPSSWSHPAPADDDASIRTEM